MLQRWHCLFPHITVGSLSAVFSPKCFPCCYFLPENLMVESALKAECPCKKLRTHRKQAQSQYRCWLIYELDLYAVVQSDKMMQWREFILLVSVTLCFLYMGFLWKLVDMQHYAFGLKREVGRRVHDVLHRALERKQIACLPENKRLTNMVFNVFSQDSNYVF